MYGRTLENNILNQKKAGKAIVVLGPRQVGKTTLIEKILNGQSYLFLNGDEPRTRALLSEPSTEQIRSIIGQHKIIFIDEAQRIEGIGLTMKIIIDRFKDIQIYASGSSAFDLSSKISEPLTGRKWEHKLYPISWEEYENHHGFLFTEQDIENRLLYGFYPEVLNSPGNEVEVLQNLVNSYLYKDILAFADIRKPDVLDKLVQALAFQVGNEVSFNELSKLLNIDKNTVSKYIDVLRKGYIIFELGSYSRNLRNEIKTNRKIYFYDVGVRNMIVGNFNSLNFRADKGALWENFLIAERLKQNEYKKKLSKVYFWRTSQQQEVDFVEDISGEVFGYEFKWSNKRKHKLPKTFTETYNARSKIIDRENFRDFVIL